MMVEYWGGDFLEEKLKPVFMKYVNRKYSNVEIVSLKIFECWKVNPFLQIKFMENGSLHDHRIRLEKLPKYCFKGE